MAGLVYGLLNGLDGWMMAAWVCGWMEFVNEKRGGLPEKINEKGGI